MIHLFIGLLFLSGLPICMFVLPHGMWPSSEFLWFIAFVGLEAMIRATAAGTERFA